MKIRKTNPDLSTPNYAPYVNYGYLLMKIKQVQNNGSFALICSSRSIQGAKVHKWRFYLYNGDTFTQIKKSNAQITSTLYRLAIKHGYLCCPGEVFEYNKLKKKWFVRSLNAQEDQKVQLL